MCVEVAMTLEKKYLDQLWMTGGSWEGLYYAKPSVTYC